MVDWSGDWATPWGLASQMRPCSEAKRLIGRPPGSFALRESEASAAKRPVGTEINPSLCRRDILLKIPLACALNLTFPLEDNPHKKRDGLQ